ncbi:leucine-rich repeat protein kinase family protein [Tasmannia lanceolata]|uniref:leucine-rich repeat protein kinase family protein n=1 Tax=Tasmannia lanceolata TaxID=3420 RepID=UPI004064634D
MPFFFLLTTIILLLSLSSPTISSLQNDTQTLSIFRSQTDTHSTLAGNWTSSDACSGAWLGVRCTSGRVTSLSLPSFSLRGPIDSLSSLDQLRFLDLHGNRRLNGSLLPLSRCFNLKLLYLSGNDFSGQIPDEFSLMKRLIRLDLSDNNLSGPIPSGLSRLTRLVTLRVQNNALSGNLPDLIGVRELNVSNNELYGKVPDGLWRKFGQWSFVGNAGLCGSGPLPECSFTDSSSLPIPPLGQTVVPSNPSSIPGGSAISVDRKIEGGKGKGLSTGAIVGIVVADAVVLLVITSFLVAYYCGRYAGEEEDADGKKRGGSSVSSNEKKSAINGGVESEEMMEQRSKLVFFDRKKHFELEDLLKASAEMLGKGSLGTVYRAILEDGSTVAVKRLKDANPCSRKDFERYMDIIGKVRHPNMVRLRAYYYNKEEKLLVYDYLPNGSLYSLLHGNRGPGRTPLDWTTRIGLVLGAARGLAWIHDEYSATKIPHGNIKSSNVLLDKNGVACIADFGLALLLNPAHATARLGGYRAPEQLETKRLSQKADVYGFGVLLLEVLTGKAPSLHYPARCNENGIDLPKWVRSTVKEEWTAEIFDAELLRYKNIEEELVAMLHVGFACVGEEAEERPTMLEVVKMIEEIRVEQSPLAEDLDESRSSLSPSLAPTEDGRPSY